MKYLIRSFFHIVFIISIAVLISSCGPRITSFTPEYGPVGTEVTVYGKRMVKNNDLTQTKVHLNGTLQPIVSGTANEIKFVVAEGTSTGKITITIGDNSTTSTSIFDVVEDFADSEGPFTFGGLSIMSAKVSPSETNQKVLFGILRSKWAPVSGVFDDFDDIVDAEFIIMNDFWTEASFGRTSFTKSYITNEVIGLPKSKDFYYHTELQRDIKGSIVSSPINFPTDKTLTIEYSEGNSFDVLIPAGDNTGGDIVTLMNDAKDAVSGAPPEITFTFTSSRFRIMSTVGSKREGHIELNGDAIPFLGFGDASFYNLSGDEPKKLFFSAPIASEDLEFTIDSDLVITTLGAVTNVNFPSGSILAVSDIVSAIEAAYPGEDQQQPFDVAAISDPLDSSKRILVIKSDVDSEGDHGFELTIGGTARTLLGMDTPGELRSYDPETFKGHTAIKDGFNSFASSLPAGTDLDAIFDDARMFVGVLADDNQLRAHASSWTFPILDDSYDASYFVARVSDIEPFTHETGHALGLPDLYKVNANTAIGSVPNNWDIMDCSRCDAHSVQWLKSRHHKEPEDQAGAWVDGSRIATISPPLGTETKIEEYILTPDESPWITANPFSASHPGIQIVQGIELVPTDPKDVFFLENRQQGVYVADHLGDQVDFSQDLPGEGVIVYEGRRLPTSGLVNFIPVNLLTPYTNPLNTNGESFEHIITNLNKIEVSIIDKIPNPDATSGAPSFSYHTRVRWGQGSFYDLAIREWNPPPWESVDIWLDNRAENDWDDYTYEDDSGNPILNGDNVQVGSPNRLYARIRNLGDIPVTDDFDVIWRIAIPQTQGAIETELGRVTVTEDIPANGLIITPPLNWTPTNSNDEHVCIKAEIVTVSGELNGTLNNAAQENFTQWYSPSASPFEPIYFEFETQNPYKDKSENILLNVQDIPSGWTVTVEDVHFRLPPSGRKRQKVKIVPILGYFQENGIIKRNKGIIDSLGVNIEAQIPYGDTWRTFGGITAIVHPVNANSTVNIDPRYKENKDGTVTVSGTIFSSGVLSPQLDNRIINLRMRGANGEEHWQRTKTSGSQFTFTISATFRWQDILVKAFHKGGKGFKPTSSDELIVEKLENENNNSQGNLIDGVLSNSSLATFSTFMLSTGLDASLKEGGYTVFAPTDQAFSSLSAEIRNKLRTNPAFLKDFLSGYLVDGLQLRSELDNELALVAISGKEIKITKRDNSIYLNGSPIKSEFIVTKNGIIYFLDEL